MSFSAKVGRSAVWAIVGQACTALLSVVNFGVVGRFVEPNEYGSFLLAMMVLSSIQWLALNAYKEPMVQTADITESKINSVFSFSLIVGTFLAAVMLGVAMYFEFVLQSNQIALCVMILAGKLWFDAVLSVPSALRVRNLDFKFLARTSIVANILATGLNIGMLLLGFGLVSLVSSQLLASIVTLGSFLYFGRRSYAFKIVIKDLNVLKGYSPHVIMWQAIEAINQTVDRYFIAARLSLSDLGFYGMGKRLNDVIIEVLVGATSSVSLPAFSQLQNDPIRLQAAFLKAVRMVTLMVLPIIAALYVTAEDFVPMFFGPKWSQAIEVYRWFLLLGVIQTIGILQGGLLRGLWKPGTWTRYMIAQCVANVVVLSIVAGYGINVLAAAIVIRSYTLWVWIVLQTCRALKLKFFFYVFELLKPISIAVASAVGGFLVAHGITNYGHLPRFLIDGATVLGIFVILGLIFLRAAIEEVILLFRKILHRDPVIT